MSPASAKVSRADVERELAAVADEERARNLAWFFKTGKGDYGEGDRFLGITVPVQRKIAHRHLAVPLPDVARLLLSPYHEHRFTALEILVAKYERGTEPEREKIFRFYLRHAKRANNWDLVDTSAREIVGAHLLARPREVLYKLARSPNIWERRIAIVSSMRFIKERQLADTFALAELLLGDKHELIHKAVGWALREAGRVSRPQLLAFLDRRYQSLPRTTLRYAIEHLPAPERKLALSGKFA